MPSLRKLFPYVLLPVAGLLIGWATVVGDRADDGKSGGDSRDAVAVSPRMRDARASAAAMTPEQLLAEARRLVETPGKKSRRATLDETIADWTDAEVVAALEQASADPDVLLRQDSMAGDLLRSFSKRDPEKAMRWALDQPLLVRRKFAGHVLSALLPGRVDEALALAKAHPDVFEGKVPTNVVRAAVTRSAQQGAVAFVSRLKELMADGSAPFMEFPKDVAKGFDFAAAMDSPDFAPLVSDMLKRSMLQAWAGEDRDAAFQWVLEKDGARQVGRLRDTRWSHAELTGHVRWMAEKVDTMPKEQWQEILAAHRSSFLSNPGHASLWLESLREPAVREAFRDAAADGIFFGGTNTMEVGLKALDSLPDDRARIDRLEKLTQEFSGYRGQRDASAEMMLRGKLEQWGADPQRAETIVENLRRAERAPTQQ